MANVSMAEVLSEVFTVARADAGLAAFFTNPDRQIAGHIPQDRPLPYIRGRISFPEMNTKCQVGYDATLTWDIWSDKHDDGEVLLIADELVRIFEEELTLTSGQNCHSHHTGTDTTIEPDGQTHRAITTFNLKINSNQ